MAYNRLDDVKRLIVVGVDRFIKMELIVLLKDTLLLLSLLYIHNFEEVEEMEEKVVLGSLFIFLSVGKEEGVIYICIFGREEKPVI